MKRAVGIVVLLLVLAGFGFAWVKRGDLALAALSRAAPQAMAADVVSTLPDGLAVALCGTGSPLPDPKRSGPCTAVIAGGKVYVVDAGDGAARTLARMHIQPQHIAGVLLTHFHSDHIDGLGALALQRWAGANAAAPLPVQGPPGVERVVAGFNEAYALDAGYRVAHHGPDIVPPTGAGMIAAPFELAGDSAVVLEADGLRITAFRVNHTPVSPAVGYRFDYKGRSVVVSGDTARSANLESVAGSADVLVHEALAPNIVAILGASATTAGKPKLAKIMGDIPGYHASPRDAAASARAAGVKALVLTHIVPGLPSRLLEPVFLDGATFNGPFWVGRDGDLIVLPAGAATIERRRSF